MASRMKLGSEGEQETPRSCSDWKGVEIHDRQGNRIVSLPIEIDSGRLPWLVRAPARATGVALSLVARAFGLRIRTGRDRD